MGFYTNYIRLCRERGISASAAAVDMGFTKSAVTRWKSGGMPSNESLASIAKYFGVSIVDLIEGNERTSAFYEKFEALCRDNKITPSRAVQEMGFSRALAAKWKHTGDTPRADTLTVIAKYFGISVDVLLGEEKEKPAPEGELSEAERYSEDERIFISILRQLDSLDREAIKIRMKDMLESNKKIKNIQGGGRV